MAGGLETETIPTTLPLQEQMCRIGQWILGSARDNRWETSPGSRLIPLGGDRFYHRLSTGEESFALNTTLIPRRELLDLTHHSPSGSWECILTQEDYTIEVPNQPTLRGRLENLPPEHCRILEDQFGGYLHALQPA